MHNFSFPNRTTTNTRGGKWHCRNNIRKNTEKITTQKLVKIKKQKIFSGFLYRKHNKTLNESKNTHTRNIAGRAEEKKKAKEEEKKKFPHLK